MSNICRASWLLSFTLLSLSSCISYQYATVSSSLNKTKFSEFVHENDSVRVVYNFNGAGGPIKITVQNKLDTPLFINWSMSSLIVDGKSQSYSNGESRFQGNGTSTEFEWTEWLSTTSSSFSGTISTAKDVSFIPPGKHITATPTHIKNGRFQLDNSVQPKRKTYQTVSGQASSLSYAFTKSNSPLHYQSYLTYSADRNFSKVATLEDDFWVNEILQTVNGPSSILDMSYKGDTFYNGKATGFSVFMSTVVLTGALVAAALTPDN